MIKEKIMSELDDFDPIIYKKLLGAVGIASAVIFSNRIGVHKGTKDGFLNGINFAACCLLVNEQGTKRHAIKYIQTQPIGFVLKGIEKCKKITKEW